MFVFYNLQLFHLFQNLKFLSQRWFLPNNRGASKYDFWQGGRGAWLISDFFWQRGGGGVSQFLMFGWQGGRGLWTPPIFGWHNMWTVTYQKPQALKSHFAKNTKSTLYSSYCSDITRLQVESLCKMDCIFFVIFYVLSAHRKYNFIFI